MNLRTSAGGLAWCAGLLALAGVLMLLAASHGRHTDVALRVPETSGSPDARFVAMDIFVDSGSKTLAAYQIEITSQDAPGQTLLSGVEGGEHPAFEAPPRYDAQALHPQDNQPCRIIIAAFDVGHDLPRGKTRVARLHMQYRGPSDSMPQLVARVMASATEGGEKIDAVATLTPSAPGTGH